MLPRILPHKCDDCAAVFHNYAKRLRYVYLEIYIDVLCPAEYNVDLLEAVFSCQMHQSMKKLHRVIIRGGM